MLESSKPAASALLEDFEHIRDVIARRATSRGELRRLSAVLRRLLVERDIALVAAPRIGRLELLGPDNSPVYDAAQRAPLRLFSSGGAEVFGATIRSVILDSLTRQIPVNALGHAVMRLDGFLSQRVLCVEGEWASREAVIKYAANVASGVHSGLAKEPEGKIVERMRSRIQYIRAANGNLELKVLTDEPPGDLFTYDPAAIDPVMFEILATATFMMQSPDIDRLAGLLNEEFKR